MLATIKAPLEMGEEKEGEEEGEEEETEETIPVRRSNDYNARARRLRYACA